MKTCNKCEMERRDPRMALCIGGPLHGHMARKEPTGRMRVTVRLPIPDNPFVSMGDIDKPVELPGVASVDYELVMLYKGSLPVYVVSGEEMLP